MKTSKNHNDLFTGILDMNGVPILKGSKIKIHHPYTRQGGCVIWKEGNYCCSESNYNIFAWRKNIEVLESKIESLFHKEDMEKTMEYFERVEFGVLTPVELRQIFKKAFRLGYESAIEHNTKSI